MRIYLMAVGTRDPFWMKRDQATMHFPVILREYGSEYRSKGLPLEKGPILVFFDRQPVDADDHIVLIVTKGEPPVVKSPTDRCGEEVKAELIQRKPSLREKHVHLERLEDVDPSELDTLYDPMKKLVQRVLHNLHEALPPQEEVDLIVNVSPGTPQMKASWYIMAHFGHLTQPFANRPLKVKLLQVKEDTWEIVPVGLTPLAAEHQIELGLRLFQDYSFQAAARVFQAIAELLEPYGGASLGGERLRARAAQIAQGLSHAYHAWSLFRNDRAKEQLVPLLESEEQSDSGKESSTSPLPGELKSLLKGQIQILQELDDERSHRHPKLKAVNAYHLAQLASHRQDWVACVVLANMAYEQSLIERLLQIVEERIGDRPDPFRWRDSLMEIERRASPERRASVQAFLKECRQLDALEPYLGVSLLVKLLKAWDREFTRDPFWQEAKDKITWIRDTTLHRMGPPTRGQAEKALETAKEALCRIFGREIEGEIRDFLFSRKAFHMLREHLQNLLT